jgi:hypothetical protein
MRRTTWVAVLALVLGVAPLRAADNTLTAAEQQQGYVLLFDGKDLSGWMSKSNKPLPSTIIQEGSLNPHAPGMSMLYTKQRYGNYVLSCDFKVSPRCNSGIFVRVGDVKDEVQTGLEIQVLDSAGRANPGKNGGGSLYDILPPSKNAMKPAGEWNNIVITADKNIIKVVLNGEEVINADLDKYTEPGKNLDGAKNKYNKAIKDFPREGHIGFQDHGQDVWFKNIKIKVLK